MLIIAIYKMYCMVSQLYDNLTAEEKTFRTFDKWPFS